MEILTINIANKLFILPSPTNYMKQNNLSSINQDKNGRNDLK